VKPFVLAVKANDFPDSNWTFGDTLSSPMSISVASSTTGIVDVNDTTGEATVRSDAPYGSYQLTFNAVDACRERSESLSAGAQCYGPQSTRFVGV
jgi:hypothetical protein